MAIRRDTPNATHFLNVDLDIHSTSSLEPLITALGKRVIVLHTGRNKRLHCAHLEVARFTKDADSTIRAFCNMISSLSRAERKLWDAAKQRDFNIGVQAGHRPHAYEMFLAVDTVKAVSELGARLVVTVYSAPGSLADVPLSAGTSAKIDSSKRRRSVARYH
jgi:hypothetical protein